MHIGRLKRFAKFLEHLSEKRFDMTDIETSAIGHACHWSELNKEGLFLHNGIIVYATDGRHIPGFATGFTLFGFDAIQIFFDLTYQQADLIFHFTSYRDKPKDIRNYDVILNMRRVIDEWWRKVIYEANN